MILDAANPSSIYCCLRAARESARSGARRDHVGDVRGPELRWLEMRGYDYARARSAAACRSSSTG